MSTLLDRLLPAIEAEAANIRTGRRDGLCTLLTDDIVSREERAALLEVISGSDLMRDGVVYATSELVRRGQADPHLGAPFYRKSVTFHGHSFAAPLDEAGLAWVADKWEEWAIDIVKSVSQEV